MNFHNDASVCKECILPVGSTHKQSENNAEIRSTSGMSAFELYPIQVNNAHCQSENNKDHKCVSSGNVVGMN